MKLEILGYKYVPPKDYEVTSVTAEGSYLRVEMLKTVKHDLAPNGLTYSRTHWLNKAGIVVVKAFEE